MTLDVWMADRHRKVLVRAGRQAACLGVLLACALVWLGAREVGMGTRAEAAREALRFEQARTSAITLKRLGLVAYLAKVRHNKILAKITSRPNSEDACVRLTGIQTLPADSPCIANNVNALESIWRAALGEHGPPIERSTIYDAWGAPILINEAEYLCARGDGWCPADTLRSVGPDGAHSTADDMIESIVPFVYRKK